MSGIDRRQFVKTAAFALGVTGMVSVASASNREILVVQVDSNINEQQAKQMLDEINSNGISAVVICSQQLFVSDKPKTFFFGTIWRHREGNC